MGTEPPPTEAPRDPNDAPMMRPPNGQPAPTPVKRSPALEPPYGGDRRFVLPIRSGSQSGQRHGPIHR